MTPKTKIILYLILIPTGLACAFFYFKGCKSGKSDVDILRDSLTIQTKLNDSIKVIQIALTGKFDSSVHKNTLDSTKFTQKLDSVLKENSKLKSKFMGTRDSLVTLHNALQQAFSQNDTARAWIIARNLNDQLTEANNQLFAWQISRDSGDVTRDVEIDRLHGVIADLQGQVKAFNDLLIQCTTNASNMAKTADLAIKKAKARGLLAKIGGGLAAVLGILLILK